MPLLPIVCKLLLKQCVITGDDEYRCAEVKKLTDDCFADAFGTTRYEGALAAQRPERLIHN